MYLFLMTKYRGNDYRNGEEDHCKGSNHSEAYSMLILGLPESKIKLIMKKLVVVLKIIIFTK